MPAATQITGLVPEIEAGGNLGTKSNDDNWIDFENKVRFINFILQEIDTFYMLLIISAIRYDK